MFASAESANIWFNAWTGVGVFGAILVVVGAAGAWRAGISKDEFSEERARHSEERISENEATAAKAFVELETQKKLTAQATEAAEREKVERLKLEAQLAPRRLTSEQGERLKAALKPSDGAVMIVSRMIDGESRDFADDLTKGLHDAGWTNTARSRMWATSDAGVFVATTQATAAAPEVKVLSQALRAAGIEAGIKIIQPEDAKTIPEEFRDRILCLLVARQPPPVTTKRR